MLALAMLYAYASATGVLIGYDKERNNSDMVRAVTHIAG